MLRQTAGVIRSPHPAHRAAAGELPENEGESVPAATTKAEPKLDPDPAPESAAGPVVSDSEETRRPRTRSDAPMSYGLGWALGPSGQRYLNGRLPGYRAAMVLVPDRDYVSVALTNQETALPALARLLSEMQQGLTGEDIAKAVDNFAA